MNKILIIIPITANSQTSGSDKDRIIRLNLLFINKIIHFRYYPLLMTKQIEPMGELLIYIKRDHIYKMEWFEGPKFKCKRFKIYNFH